MEALEILKSLLDTGAVDDSIALIALKELHQKGVINLVKHLHEQCMTDLRGVMSRDVVDTVVGRLGIIRDLLPDSDDVLAIVEDDNYTTDEILGGE